MKELPKLKEAMKKNLQSTKENAGINMLSGEVEDFSLQQGSLPMQSWWRVESPAASTKRR